MLEPSFLLFVCVLFCSVNFSRCSDSSLVSILGERSAVQTSVCLQQSVWRTPFLQSAALVIIGIQEWEKVSPGVSTKACILYFDFKQNFRDFLLQKGGFHKRQSPKLKWMKEIYPLSCLTLLLGRVSLALKSLQTNCAIIMLCIRTWIIRIYV